MKIGIISDTHNFFDPKIPKIFKGVDHILHAGDIGQPQIIHQLESIAPVTAVLGNTDVGLHYRQTEVVKLGGRKFLVHHIVDAQRPSEVLQRRLSRENPDVVVFGHTHKPFNELIGHTLYFNPGSAGKKRFSLPRTLAILHCDAKGIRPEYFDL
ncbi:metallophosphoesterase family protein [Pedosphaera parvula]|uniref:Phosphoesterase n=1 Tax=Pedosphaera parvula (strain Ellin514) TaxID=320771 RepID=B9XBU0_PEDPL|nr:metallophosphoesterase family protein [Pedosphaera parvula]EEF62408.1 phosphodiesterase, MJ0936 family [Pedosphaera parvula Ellin514]